MSAGRLDGLLLLAAFAAIRLSHGLDANQVQLLSAFFEVLGDDLALLAAGMPGGGDGGRERPSKETSPLMIS